MNSGKGNMILLTIIAVVTLLSSVVGTTFIIGFSSNNKEFSSNTADSNVSTIGGQNVAKISTNFTNGNSISGANFNAGDVVATKTFVLQGNVYDAIDLNYNVELFVEENGYSDGSLAYTLTSTSSDKNGKIIASTTNSKAIVSGKGFSIDLGDGYCTGSTGDNSTHTYVLQIKYVNAGTDQTVNAGKTFKATIKVN